MIELNSRILIVDPDFSAREKLRKELTDLGFTQIQECHNAREAVAALDREVPAVVFSDWELQEAGGLALLKLVKYQERFSRIHFILTAVPDPEPSEQKDKELRAQTAKADGFILKPYRTEKLRSALTLAEPLA